MILKIGIYNLEINSFSWLYIENIKNISVVRAIQKEIESIEKYKDWRYKDIPKDFVQSDYLFDIAYNDNNFEYLKLSNFEKAYLLNNDGKTIENLIK